LKVIDGNYGHDHGELMSTRQITFYLNETLLPFAHTKEILFEEFSKNVNLPIDTSFLTPARLFEIFTHKSFHHENNRSTPHNERLEFLGDAVLDLIISDKLIRQYPEKSEGDLSKLRSALVNENSLSSMSRKLKLNQFILLGRGELKAEGFSKDSILSDVFEALLGGVYLDHGASKAFDFFDEILRFLTDKHDFVLMSDKHLNQFDAKTKLQELVMKDYKVTPNYEINEVNNNFEIQFKINEVVIAEHTSISKKKGMQELARKILNEELLKNKNIKKSLENLCY
jgi:ribonuclease-3